MNRDLLEGNNAGFKDFLAGEFAEDVRLAFRLASAMKKTPEWDIERRKRLNYMKGVLITRKYRMGCPSRFFDEQYLSPRLRAEYSRRKLIMQRLLGF